MANVGFNHKRRVKRSTADDEFRDRQEILDDEISVNTQESDDEVEPKKQRREVMIDEDEDELDFAMETPETSRNASRKRRKINVGGNISVCEGEPGQPFASKAFTIRKTWKKKYWGEWRIPIPCAV